jgi:hypothetical protein
MTKKSKIDEDCEGLSVVGNAGVIVDYYEYV